MTVLAIATFASCDSTNEIDEKEEASSLSVKSKDIVIAAQGGSTSFTVESDGGFVATASQSWVEVGVVGNIVTVSAPKNATLETRYSELTISNGKDAASLMVHQRGYITTDASFANINVSYASQVVELEYDYPMGINASTEAEWIILDNGEAEDGTKILRVNVGENMTGAERVATVKWTLGLKDGSFTVTQKEYVKPYTQNDKWTVKYSGKVEDGDNVSHKIVVSGVGVPYVFKAISAKALAEKGFSNISEYVASLEDEAKTLYKEGSLSSGDLDFNVPESELAGGVNYAVVAGYSTAKDELSGEFNFVKFEIEGPDLRTPYEKWLGTWEIERGSEIDVWTISRNVDNVSYTILGVDGTSKANTPDVPVIAEFDSETGNLIIKAQNCGTYTGDSYGEADLTLYGLGPQYYYSWSGNPYTIATLSLSGKDSANLTPGTVQSGAVTLVSMFILIEPKSGEGKYVFDQNVNYSFPCTLKQLTQEGGSGGGEDPNPGNGSYAGWLGNWNYSSDGGDYYVTISQKSAGTTYTITGFTGEYPIEAGYDAATNGLFINGYQLLEKGYQLSNGVTVDLYLFSKDTENYIELGNPEKNYRLVLGKLGADGKTATFVGDEYDAVYSGQTWHEIIAKFGVVGMTEDEEFWTLGAYPLVDVPGTLTKTSAGVSRKVVSAGVTARCSIETAPSSYTNNNFQVESLCKIRVK